jgi:hypothetical protein
MDGPTSLSLLVFSPVVRIFSRCSCKKEFSVQCSMFKEGPKTASAMEIAKSNYIQYSPIV